MRRENIQFRNATTDDAHLLLSWWNDGRIMGDVGFPNGLGLSLEDVYDSLSLRTDFNSQLIIEIDGKPVGEMHLGIDLDNPEIAYPGWKICELEYQNKGYGTQAINLCLDYLFTDEVIQGKYQIKRVEINVLYENTRAHHVYEHKVGMNVVSHHKNTWKDPQGTWRDSISYSISKEDHLNRVGLRHRQLTDDEVIKICEWKYEGDYAMYNLPSYEELKRNNYSIVDANKQENYRVYYEGERLVGFTNLINEGNTVFLGIGVNPQCLNQKYGQRILKSTLELSKEINGDKPVYLEVRTWNQRAVRAYERSGFMIVATINQKTKIGDGEFYRMEYHY